MNGIQFCACYDFNGEWYLIEMVLETAPSRIDWMQMAAPEDGVPRSNWQCPYLEQYLNASGTARLCPLYDLPEEDASPCRVAFFLYKTAARVLRTPYGDVPLDHAEALPQRLARIVEFAED